MEVGKVRIGGSVEGGGEGLGVGGRVEGGG